jgi:hypothetical protein
MLNHAALPAASVILNDADADSVPAAVQLVWAGVSGSDNEQRLMDLKWDADRRLFRQRARENCDTFA